MSESIEKVLLIDVGNTRLKSAILNNNELHVNSPVVHTKNSASKICRQLLEAQQPTISYISSVLDSNFEHSVKEYCHSSQIQVAFMQSTAEAFGLRNAYQVPEKLGVDRFVAMLGALDLGILSEAKIIVDAGTALTIDIVLKNGKHLGGTITPGLQAMFTSLHRNTQLDQQSVIDYGLYKKRFYADNSEDAIILGTLNTFIAGIKHTIEQTIEHITSDVSIILTGGDAEFIAQGLELDCQVYPDLVLRGLQKIYNHEQHIN